MVHPGDGGWLIAGKGERRNSDLLSTQRPMSLRKRIGRIFARFFFFFLYYYIIIILYIVK